MFAWHEHLYNMICPNYQVKMRNEVFLSIYSNFIPNKIKTVGPHQAPWIAQAVKNFLRKKYRAYKSFVRRGRPDDKLEDIQKMMSEGTRLTEEAKRNYFFKAGKTLANSRTSSKTCWSLINAVLSKAKISLMPPLLENGLFTTLAQIFNNHFVHQCTTIDIS